MPLSKGQKNFAIFVRIYPEERSRNTARGALPRVPLSRTIMMSVAFTLFLLASTAASAAERTVTLSVVANGGKTDKAQIAQNRRSRSKAEVAGENKPKPRAAAGRRFSATPAP